MLHGIVCCYDGCTDRVLFYMNGVLCYVKWSECHIVLDEVTVIKRNYDVLS